MFIILPLSPDRLETLSGMKIDLGCVSSNLKYDDAKRGLCMAMDRSPRNQHGVCEVWECWHRLPAVLVKVASPVARVWSSA